MAKTATKRITETNGDTSTAPQSLAEVRAANAEKCIAEVNASLAKYECAFVCSMLATEQGNKFHIQIVSK